MSKTISIHHCVFATKNRRDTIPESQKKELFSYILGILKNYDCHLFRINGYKNHVHMVLDLHPSRALAHVMRDLKTATSIWLKENVNFPDFEGWGVGYFASSVSHSHLNDVIKYIRNQESHHASKTFDDELITLSTKNGMSLHCQDLA